MNTLNTEAEISADGTVKVLSPLPEWWQVGKQQITLQLADASTPRRRQPPPPATPEMLERRKLALAELRAMGGIGDVIPDPVAWQREQRMDRSLPGRD